MVPLIFAYGREEGYGHALRKEWRGKGRVGGMEKKEEEEKKREEDSRKQEKEKKSLVFFIIKGKTTTPKQC